MENLVCADCAHCDLVCGLAVCRAESEYIDPDGIVCPMFVERYE